MPRTDLNSWLEERRPALERIAQQAVEAYRNDHRIRVPRSSEDRVNAFEPWLRFHRDRLPVGIHESLKDELSGVTGVADPVAEAVDKIVWPEVEAYLRSYAIRGHAAAWMSHRYRGATILGMAEPVGSRWRVPLGFRGEDVTLGDLILEADGTVVEELSTSPEALERILASRP